MRRSLARAVVAVVLSALAFAAQAQVQLVFPNEAERVAWVDLPTVGPAPDSAQKSKALKLSLSTGALGAESAVFVIDSSTGDLATKAVSAITREGGTWKLASKDFDRVHHIQVRLTSAGKRVAAAQVDLAHSKGEAQALVTPSDDGTANFYGIGFGDLKVKVTVKAEGQVADLPTYTFVLERSRDQAVPMFEVAVAPNVDVVTEAPGTTKDAEPTTTTSPGDTKTAPEPAPATTGGGSNFAYQAFILIIGLVLGGALIYFLPRLVEKNRTQVDSVLSKMGVQIPTDPAPDDAAAGSPPAAPAQPVVAAPQPQILLDQAAPVATIQQPIAQPISGSPALVSPTTGARMELVEGCHVVSREPGSPLSLIGEMSVSRAHAELAFNQGTWTVEDLGSTNGTYVNGQRIAALTPLKAGDLVQFGTSTWRVEGI